MTTPIIQTIPLTLSPQEKILAKIDELEMALLANKKSTELVLLDIRNLKKQVKKLKPQKKQKVPKTDRKPHGFAVPSIVSEELCLFMKVEPGTLVSRTNVTKKLTEYISENKLQNVDNKRQILPDTILSSLLGEAAKDQYLTHFTIQKYMNHHFLKSSAALPKTEV